MTAILVIFTIIIFLILDYFAYRKKGTALIQIARDTIENEQTNFANNSVINEDEISLPQGIFLHPKHTWAYVLPSGKVKVGVDAFISKLIGSVDKIVLPPVGQELKKGQPVLNIFSKNKKLDLISPIDGKVISVNNELMENPKLLDDPYNSGWSVIINPSHLSTDLSSLKISEEALKILKHEFKRFREFILNFANGSKLGLQTLQDGGLPVKGILTSLDKEKWEKFQKEFLNLE